MVIVWEITKHETEANASVAGGFLRLQISRMKTGEFRGFIVKINGHKMKFRPSTMHVAMKAVDEMMQAPVGAVLAAMEPAGNQNPNSNRLTVSELKDRICKKHGVICNMNFSADTTRLGQQQHCDKICNVSGTGGF